MIKIRSAQFLLASLILLLSSSVNAQDVMVIANQDVKIAEIGDAELQEIFTGIRSRFHDGSRAVPVLLKGGPAHEVFLRKHVSETADSFRALWRKAVFTGQGAAPKEFASEAALQQYVATTPGAIGYVSRVSSEDQVKVLVVINAGTHEGRIGRATSPGGSR